MEWLSNNLIDEIIKHEMFIRQQEAPEFVVMRESVDELKVIFDLYITPNIAKRIPETIALKFNLNDKNQKQIVEDSHIEWNPYNPKISGDLNQFIVEQIVLQLLWIAPSIPREIVVPESNIAFEMKEDQVMVLGNANAITPIHFNRTIIDNKNIFPMLTFVTSTTFGLVTEASTEPGKRPRTIYSWLVETAPLNTVDLVSYGQYKPPITDIH
jgi:hypothetical protein